MIPYNLHVRYFLDLQGKIPIRSLHNCKVRYCLLPEVQMKTEPFTSYKFKSYSDQSHRFPSQQNFLCYTSSSIAFNFMTELSTTLSDSSVLLSPGKDDFIRTAQDFVYFQ